MPLTCHSHSRRKSEEGWYASEDVKKLRELFVAEEWQRLDIWFGHLWLRISNVFLLWIVLIPASSCWILSEHCYSWNLIVSAGMTMIYIYISKTTVSWTTRVPILASQKPSQASTSIVSGTLWLCHPSQQVRNTSGVEVHFDKWVSEYTFSKVLQ